MAHDGPAGDDTAKRLLSPEEEVQEAFAELALHTGPLTERLVALFDVKLFPFIYRKQHGAVFRQARLRGLSKEAAEDVMQDAFVKFRELVIAVEFPRSIPALLRTITSRLLLNHVRDEGRDPLSLGLPGSESEPAQSGPDAERVVGREQQAAFLLHMLSPEHRAVIQVVELLELDHQEAADALGIPLATLRSRLIKARARLVELAREHYPPSRKPSE